MPIAVTDVRSNAQDQIAEAAKAIGRSKDRLKVFIEIHKGRQKVKTATEIAGATNLPRKRVLEEAVKLVHKQIVHPTKRHGEIAYERDGLFYSQRAKIIALVSNPKKLDAFPTKYSPKVSSSTITLQLPTQYFRTAGITIDEIDSFRHVKSIKTALRHVTVREEDFKHGIQKIIGEAGEFKDWGGENSDLYTTRLRLKSTRRSAALAFKGRGLKGILTPARMGKNGDQIPRLFAEDAEVFLVQYNGQIAPTVIQLMALLAQNKSWQTGKKIYYGTVDGQDSARLIAAYPEAFKMKTE